MSMSPHHYKAVKKKAEDLIAKVSELISTGKSPIYYKDDLNYMIMEVNRCLGSLDTYIAGLSKTSDKRDEYHALVDEMEQLSNTLQSKRKELEQWAKR